MSTQTDVPDDARFVRVLAVDVPARFADLLPHDALLRRVVAYDAHDVPVIVLTTSVDHGPATLTADAAGLTWATDDGRRAAVQVIPWASIARVEVA